eukprot:3247038-Rhodomonas_salina.1
MGVQPAARAVCSRSVPDALSRQFSICATRSSGSGLQRASCALESCEGISVPPALAFCPSGLCLATGKNAAGLGAAVMSVEMLQVHVDV